MVKKQLHKKGASEAFSMIVPILLFVIVCFLFLFLFSWVKLSFVENDDIDSIEDSIGKEINASRTLNSFSTYYSPYLFSTFLDTKTYFEKNYFVSYDFLLRNQLFTQPRYSLLFELYANELINNPLYRNPAYTTGNFFFAYGCNSLIKENTIFSRSFNKNSVYSTHMLQSILSLRNSNYCLSLYNYRLMSNSESIDYGLGASTGP